MGTRLWVRPAQGDTQKTGDSPGSASYPNPDTKTFLVVVLLSRPDGIWCRALSSDMRLLCKHLNLKVVLLILAFGH